MSQKTPQKLYEKILYSKVMLLILLVAIFFMGKGVIGLYDKKQSTGETLELIRAEWERAQERRSVLEKKLDDFETEKGIEMEIRDMFNVAKEGEKVIVIVDTPKEEEVEEIQKEALWYRIIDIFLFWR